jgi:transmembrane sensor
MTQDEYIALYEKYLAGGCSPVEIKTFLAYRDHVELTDAPWEEEAMGNEQDVKNLIYNRLLKHTESRPRRILPMLSKWAAAAILLVAFSAGFYFWSHRNAQKITIAKNTNTKSQLHSSILPGGNKAILTLANGASVVLDNSKNGVISMQGHTTINKVAQGELVYNSKGTATDASQFNTVSTPRGGQYQIMLSDGTRVWLNAASSLRFPTTFQGAERNVELHGEAYFEVAKNKHMPFKVKVNETEVQVLGTHFNIMGYSDESYTQTTLLEGSVKISKGGVASLLRPGQQSVTKSNSAAIVVSDANIEGAIAWQKGNFIFYNENITSIMRKISRWYNVDVVYQGDVQNQDFDGSISRFENVADVLHMLELTRTVHFKIEGRSITVMP